MITVVIVTAALPLASALAGALSRSARACGVVAIVSGLAELAGATWLLVHVLAHRPISGLSGFVYVDGTSAFFGFTIGLVIAGASFGSATYIRTEQLRGELSTFQVRLYFAAFGVFASMMAAAVMTGNLGLLFVLVEASTLASVVTVGLEAKPRSLEAAWKYVIISSLGVTIALVATLYLFYAGSHLQLSEDLRLTWPYLYAHAQLLTHPSLRLAFLLAVIGYGTKVGLVPMHTWLPDAHAEAPSPASAMLSAALLNTGMYAIIRFYAIAQVGLGAAYVHRVMLLFGFLSVGVAALFLVRSGNMKRLFAYSSIEHMGIIAIGLGFGGAIGTYGALLHVLNHAIGKSTLFLVSGDTALGYRTRETRKITGMLSAMPFAGGVLLLSTMAILGAPPFGLFLSEFTIVRAGFAGSGVSGAVLAGFLLLLLAIAFVGLARTINGMVTGPAPHSGEAPTEKLRAYVGRYDRVVAAVPLVAGLGGLLLLGVWVPGGLQHAIMSAIGTMS
jgi:hydrogenase-4 component F